MGVRDMYGIKGTPGKKASTHMGWWVGRWTVPPDRRTGKVELKPLGNLRIETSRHGVNSLPNYLIWSM